MSFTPVLSVPAHQDVGGRMVIGHVTISRLAPSERMSYA